MNKKTIGALVVLGFLSLTIMLIADKFGPKLVGLPYVIFYTGLPFFASVMEFVYASKNKFPILKLVVLAVLFTILLIVATAFIWTVEGHLDELLALDPLRFWLIFGVLWLPFAIPLSATSILLPRSISYTYGNGLADTDVNEEDSSR